MGSWRGSTLAALTYLLTVTLEEHPEIGLSSYDRIIPCQDALPKGGLGNLIALPLQREPRQVDNSVFVNDDLVPLADQWAFLSSVRRVTREEVETLQRRGSVEHRLLLQQTRTEGRDDRPWEFFAPLWGAFEPPQSIPTAVAAARPIEVVLSNRVYIAQESLTQTARSELIRAASFVNPEFYEAQRMRLSVFGKPRVITRAFGGEKYLELPRGCLESARKILERQGYLLEVSDKRYSGVPLDVSFNGELRPMQKDAAKSLKAHDSKPRNGIIARAMSWTSYVEKSGSGTGDIINKCRAWGLPDPEYCPDNVDFKTIIWRNEKVTPVTNLTPVKNLTPVRGGKAKKTRVDALKGLITTGGRTGGKNLPPVGRVTPVVAVALNRFEQIVLALSNGAMGCVDLAQQLGIVETKNLRRSYARVLLDDGIIEFTIPEKPNSRLQKYRLTAKGKRLAAGLRANGSSPVKGEST